MRAIKNAADLVVGEQKLGVGDVGNDVASEYVLPPSIGRAYGTGSGVEYLGDILHHLVDYGCGHGFGGVGYIQ